MKMPATQQHNRRAGFTLIEVVAAIVILSVAILPLAQVFYIGNKIVHLVKEDSDMLFISDSAAEIYLSYDFFTPFMGSPDESQFFYNNKFQSTVYNETDRNLSPAGTLWINRITLSQKTAAEAGAKPKTKTVNSLHTNVLRATTLAMSKRKYLTGLQEKILNK